MGTSARRQELPWWVPLWRFAIHVLVASGVFLLAAVPAVLLDFLVRWLSHHNVSTLIVAGLQLAEYGIFAVDVVMVIAWSIRAAWRAWKEL